MATQVCDDKERGYEYRVLRLLQNYRHGGTPPNNHGSIGEESDEATTPDNELDPDIVERVRGKSESNDDDRNSEHDEPDYGPEDGLEDKMARFSFQSDGGLFEVLCYDVAGDAASIKGTV